MSSRCAKLREEDSGGVRQRELLTRWPSLGCGPSGSRPGFRRSRNGSDSSSSDSHAGSQCRAKAIAGPQAPRTPKFAAQRESALQEPSADEKDSCEDGNRSRPSEAGFPSGASKVSSGSSHFSQRCPDSHLEAVGKERQRFIGEVEATARKEQVQRKGCLKERRKEQAPVDAPKPWQREEFQEVRQMDVEDWLTYMKTMSSHCTDSPYALGLGLRHALLRAPTSWGSAARRQHALTLTAKLGLGDGKEAFKRHGDLLPLPLQMSAEDVAWDRDAGDFLSLRSQQPDELLSFGQRAWVPCRVMVLRGPPEFGDTRP